MVQMHRQKAEGYDVQDRIQNFMGEQVFGQIKEVLLMRGSEIRIAYGFHNSQTHEIKVYKVQNEKQENDNSRMNHKPRAKRSRAFAINGIALPSGFPVLNLYGDTQHNVG